VPQTLVLHLKRFRAARTGLTKCADKVQILPEIDLAPFMHINASASSSGSGAAVGVGNGCQSVRYKLQGMFLFLQGIRV
jgi:hypothetical protein